MRFVFQRRLPKFTLKMEMIMKLNPLTPTNLESVLKESVLANRRAEIFIANIQDWLQTATHDTTNHFHFDLLETDKIYHLEEIKEVCIDYRLRFLDVKYFKGTIPQAAKDKIADLENAHQTSIDGFKIMAPSVMFRLAKTDDPLLFAPLGNDYFYLIHKWGKDLHPLRKLRMLPFRNIWNLLLFLLIISYGLTVITPMGLFTKNADATAFWMLYFFMFKAVASVVLFCGIALGKNFNPAIWNSKYNKS